jgi:spermidine/putrescine transport system ATP-binding protein
MDTSPPIRRKAIEVHSVSKTFADFTALTDVSFDIYDNEFFTMLGPSGCGKTTLLRMMAGFETPSTGTIALHGQDLAGLPPHKRNVNTVFQSYALFPHMTLEQNIAFGLENRKWEKEKIRARVADMLKLVHMSAFATRKPQQLSGGQRQRIALARALAPKPEVLLLDEPLSALDLKLRQAMRHELRSLQKQTGITFVFVTHDQEEALEMSDRICVLGNGVVQQLGTPTDIYENPVNRFVADFIGETNFLDVAVTHIANGEATVTTPFGTTITAPHTGVRAGQTALMSLRPETLDFVRTAKVGQLSGVIASRHYMGGYTHYVVRVAGNDLKVTRRNNAYHGLALDIGDIVHMGFANDSVRILKP